MNRARKPAKRTKRQTVKKTSQKRPTIKRGNATQSQSDCPYRPGTLYGALFTEGSKDFIGRPELIQKVAAQTGKSEKVVGFAYQVLKSPKHQSNKGRSKIVTHGETIKLVAIRK